MKLKTARDVIEALGGLAAVARMCGVSYTTASAYQTRLQAFPAKTYLVMQAELSRLGHSAPTSLWQMVHK